MRMIKGKRFTQSDLSVIWDALYGRRVNCCRGNDKDRAERITKVIEKIDLKS